MSEHPILFSAPMVRALIERRKRAGSPRRIYVKKGEDRNSAEHIKNRIVNGVSIDENTECWNWVRSKNKHGYGQITINGRNHSAYRESFRVFNGPIPPGLQVLHDCDNPPCVNPKHLHLGTQSQNMQEAIIRKRLKPPIVHMRGERNGASKLTTASVNIIRERLACGDKRSALAKQFNVSVSLIGMIKRRVVWSAE